MAHSCFNCIRFTSCPILKKSREGEYDGLDDLFINEYGKYCVDFIEK